MDESKTSRLSYTRYEKVDAVMRSDPRIKSLLSPPDQWIGRQNQTGTEFSKEVVDVTIAIHDQGLDAYALKPHQILHCATELLVLTPAAKSANGEPPAAPAPAAKPLSLPKAKVEAKAEVKPATRTRQRSVPAPKAEAKSPAPKGEAKPAAQPAKPKPVKKSKASKPAAVSRAESEASADAEPPPAPLKPVTPTPAVPVAPATEPAVSPVVATPAPADLPATTSTKPPASSKPACKDGVPASLRSVAAAAPTVVTARPPVVYVRKSVPYVPGVAVLSNLAAAQTLLEPYACEPEAKEVIERLVRLIDDIHAKTVLPGGAPDEAKAI